MSKTHFETVASIALANQFADQRGEIRIGETTEGWRVQMMRPDGETETDGAVFTARYEALEAIQAMRGRAGALDLQWL